MCVKALVLVNKDISGVAVAQPAKREILCQELVGPILAPGADSVLVGSVSV